MSLADTARTAKAINKRSKSLQEKVANLLGTTTDRAREIAPRFWVGILLLSMVPLAIAGDTGVAYLTLLEIYRDADGNASNADMIFTGVAALQVVVISWGFKLWLDGDDEQQERQQRLVHYTLIGAAITLFGLALLAFSYQYQPPQSNTFRIGPAANVGLDIGWWVKEIVRPLGLLGSKASLVVLPMIVALCLHVGLRAVQSARSLKREASALKAQFEAQSELTAKAQARLSKAEAHFSALMRKLRTFAAGSEFAHTRELAREELELSYWANSFLDEHKTEDSDNEE